MQRHAIAFTIVNDRPEAVRADGVFGLEHFAGVVLNRLMILHRPSPSPCADTILRPDSVSCNSGDADAAIRHAAN